MITNKFNKASFNNFKAFGEEMQEFSIKPITLIYGPNSIGKSSFLHSQLFLEYFKENYNHLNIVKTAFAGDELDLGGFKNIIHKHDIKKTMVYKFEYFKKNDILNILSSNSVTLMELYEKKFFEQNITIENIVTKLDSNYKNFEIKFKYLLETIVLEKIFAYEHINFKNENELNKDKEKLNSKMQNIRQNAMADHFNTTIEKLYEIDKIILDNYEEKFNNAIQSLKEEQDTLEKAMLFTLHTNAEDMMSRITFLKYLVSIQNIQYNLKLQYTEDSEVDIVIELYIDNEQVFTYKLADKTLSVNEKHLVIREFNHLSKKKHLHINISHPWNNYNDYNFSFKLIIENSLFNKNKNQYYGPLRYYPERWELYDFDKNEKKDDTKKSTSIKSKVIGNLILFVFQIEKKFSDKNNNFIFEFIGLILSTIGMFLLIIGSLIDKNYRDLLVSNDNLIDLFNQVLSVKFNIIRKHKFKSRDAFKNLINSEILQDKLNNWLQDVKKLKSSYSIKVSTHPITYLHIFLKRLGKLLNTENINYAKKIIEFDNIDKADSTLTRIFYKIGLTIQSVWNFCERKLKIKQRYEKKLIFTDLSTNTEVTPRDMGLGISQVLPLLISAMGDKNTKLFIEQPELHLHPAVQMELMDEFIKSFNENKNEFILETHSEHMLLRIMKRIKQTSDGTIKDDALKLTTDDICLLYVDKDEHQTYIQELRLNKKGKLLDHWPNGFFEEGYKERFL